jgi:hypothetical protein
MPVFCFVFFFLLSISRSVLLPLAGSSERTFGFHKSRRVLEQLQASEEELCSMRLMLVTTVGVDSETFLLAG